MINRLRRSLLPRWPWLLAGLLASMAVLGCETEKPILIGFVAGTSGRVADLGISGRDAVQLVIEQCNQNGGIGGRQVRLLIKDDQQNADVARQAVRELIDAGVVAIIGPMTSDMAIAIAPVVDQSRVLTVSPTATTQLLSGRDDYFFRVTSTTREYASKSARYQFKTAGLRRIAAAYDEGNRSFCENWLDNFRKTFTGLGGQVIATVGFNTKEQRAFLDIAGELLSARPEGVLIIANSMDSALLCQQIRKTDAHIKITLADWGATERLLELGGKAVENVTVVQTFDRESQAPAYQAFRKAYRERYSREPGFPGVYSHDAAQVVLAALRARDKGQSLKARVLKMRTFTGLQSDFSFDDFGDVRRLHASISVVRNQKFVVVE